MRRPSSTHNSEPTTGGRSGGHNRERWGRPDLGLILIPSIGSLVIRALYATLRVRHVNAAHIEHLDSEGRYYILAFWHAHLPMMFFARFRLPITVMSSQHRDGELSARNMERFGATVVRGSSTRGGAAALRAMVKCARSGSNLAFTPDGPRGPARVAQSGAIAAAQMTGLPIVPVAVLSERKKILRSWDRMEIPKPFSRITFVYGEPIDVPRRLDEKELESYRKTLEDRLNQLGTEPSESAGIAGHGGFVP